jgi:hypothetical protein
MRKFIVLKLTFIFLIMLSSCDNQNFLDIYNCKIIKTETPQSFKRIIYIQISTQLTEQQLTEIAAQMREENSSYERLFVFYLLPDMEIGSGAWAVTNYNPELEVRIFGTDNESENKMKSATVENGEIVGKWYDNSPGVEKSIIIYKIDEVYKIRYTFADESLSEQDLEFFNENGKSKFVYENDFGEYYLIEEDGSLGVYDTDGLIHTSKEIF